MDLKGTQSEKNVQAALAGESIARNKYTFYAAQARKEGLDEIADLFERMARNESTHAKIWFTTLYGAIGGSQQNLQSAAAGENDEWSGMYPSFAKTAREEGFEQLALMFEKVGAIERDHEKTFLEALVALMKGGSSKKEQEHEDVKPVIKKKGYRCVFCGAAFDHRPDVCPVCQAIGSFDACEITE